MCLSLYDYQSKASIYRKGLTYLKNRATTNEKHTINSQKPKHKIKGNHETTKRKTEKERNKEETKNQLENKVLKAINIYISVITLTVNGLNAPIKRHRVADWIEKTRVYNMLPTRDSP